MNAFAPMNARASHYSGCSAGIQKSLAAFPSLRWSIATEIGCPREVPPRKPLARPMCPLGPGGLGLATSAKRWVRLARLGQSTQPLTSWRCGRGVSY
jgi:hypothetical protein